MVDDNGNGLYREGKIVGYDAAYDLAVLKVICGFPFYLCQDLSLQITISASLGKNRIYFLNTESNVII